MSAAKCFPIISGSILDKIDYEAHNHIADHGTAPNVLYLGRKEMKEFCDAVRHHIKEDAWNPHHLIFNGCKVYGLQVPSHFNISHLPAE